MVEKDFRDRDGKTYGGMNYYAAKQVGIKYPYPEDTLAVSKTSNKLETVTHEAIELTIFRRIRGIKYKNAHELTIMVERTIWVLMTEGYLKNE